MIKSTPHVEIGPRRDAGRACACGDSEPGGGGGFKTTRQTTDSATAGRRVIIGESLELRQ